MNSSNLNADLKGVVVRRWMLLLFDRKHGPSQEVFLVIRLFIEYLLVQSAPIRSNPVDLLIDFYRKATCLNRSFSPAWLALGHSFAQESEHDQATSAYFTAAQIMKGFQPSSSFFPISNLVLKKRFFKGAFCHSCTLVLSTHWATIWN